MERTLHFRLKPTSAADCCAQFYFHFPLHIRRIQGLFCHLTASATQPVYIKTLSLSWKRRGLGEANAPAAAAETLIPASTMRGKRLDSLCTPQQIFLTTTQTRKSTILKSDKTKNSKSHYMEIFLTVLKNGFNPDLFRRFLHVLNHLKDFQFSRGHDYNIVLRLHLNFEIFFFPFF